MNNYLATLFLFLSITTTVKSQENQTISFANSQWVDTLSADNKQILHSLDQFLNTKNQHFQENEFWISSDFERFKYPFYEIIGLEYDRNYNITKEINLMEIYDINENEKLIKLGYLEPDSIKNTTTIQVIYNIIATKSEGPWKFKRAVDYITRDWQKLQQGSILYYLPPGKIPNEKEIELQLQDISQICSFFDTSPFEISYYSCNSPKQVFEVKGFDYHPSMLISETGGMAAYGNIIYSGNNSEFYTHEIVHIYTMNLYPKAPQILNEGLATFLGGSGKNDYSWHRNNFSKYMDTSKIDLSEHMQPFERLYINDETPIPYMIGALICERTLRIYGKASLLKLLNPELTLWPSLNEVGLNKKNLTLEIKNELKLSLITKHSFCR